MDLPYARVQKLPALTSLCHAIVYTGGGMLKETSEEGVMPQSFLGRFVWFMAGCFFHSASLSNVI